jgi:hypothetical protein
LSILVKIFILSTCKQNSFGQVPGAEATSQERLTAALGPFFPTSAASAALF